MAGEVYINKGTAKLINGEAGADVAWTMHGLANGAGRVSAQMDWGSLPRPSRYEWHCEVQWQATPTQGGVLELYIATAPDNSASFVDGNVGTTNAALSDLDKRRNLRAIGAVVSEEASASVVCRASGEFECSSRYFSLVGVNSAGAAINATDTNFVFWIQPVYDQAQ